MVAEYEHRILEYLKKQGSTNTFRLARELKFDRHKVLDILKDLEERKAIEHKTGSVKFLQFPKEQKKAEEKPVKTEKVISKPSIKSKVIGNLQDENKKLREEIKLLQKHANMPPKIIRKVIVKQVPIKVKELMQQDKERIGKLEKTIRELKEKASAAPKVVTRTVIRRVRVPVKIKAEEAKSKKFKFPKINLPGIKNIQNLERPEFLEQKIRAGKFNFSALNRNIQQLHVPETLRNP